MLDISSNSAIIVIACLVGAFVLLFSLKALNKTYFAWIKSSIYFHFNADKLIAEAKKGDLLSVSGTSADSDNWLQIYVNKTAQPMGVFSAKYKRAYVRGRTEAEIKCIINCLMQGLQVRRDQKMSPPRGMIVTLSAPNDNPINDIFYNQII